MEIKFTDMDIVDANITFSRDYLTKARHTKDIERLLKLLTLAHQSIISAIKQIDKNAIINFENKKPLSEMKHRGNKQR